MIIAPNLYDSHPEASSPNHDGMLRLSPFILLLLEWRRHGSFDGE